MSDATPDGAADADQKPQGEIGADTNAEKQSDSTQVDSPSEPTRPSPQNQRKDRLAVVVRYGHMRQIGSFRHNLDKPVVPCAKVVVRTERGVEIGEVVSCVCSNSKKQGCITPARLDEFVSANGPDFPFRRNGKVLRLANHQDVIDFRHLEGSAREEAAYCREQIREMGLSMRIVSVEHLLGGERIIFSFSSQTRVDFRELVRRLAAQYHTRIEMRQVGARDEARLVADYERCGRRCCCQQFIKDLKPVSMRMAKTQKATLDPAKISGRCGRLMCCLRYEDAGYEDLRKKLPRKNTWVRTEELTGRVLAGQILTQLIRVALPDGAIRSIHNEDITEYNVAPPDKDAKTPLRREPRKPKPEAKSSTESAPTETDGEPQKTGKKRRRRKRKRRSDDTVQTTSNQQTSSAPADNSAKPQGDQSQPSGEGAEGRPKKKRRRRRKRKKKPDANQPNQ